MSGGKLCVSVIEARNVYADEYAERNFYVKLKVGPNEIRTDIVKGTLQPKFLKDCRLAVQLPETDVLRIELLQVGPHGDLVVGSDELRILSITSKGTIVHWFELKTSMKTVGAELCLVLRYLSAGANRPMSPSYAIAARQAKERALDSPQTPTVAGPARALFTDPPTVARPAAVPVPVNAAPVQQPGLGLMPLMPDTTSPAPVAPVAGPSGQTTAPQYSQQSQRNAKPRVHKLGNVTVPLPVAMLCGALVGAVVYLWKKRPVFYEVQEDDTLCDIATCFKKNYRELYAKNKDLLAGGPDTIYPGDRIRIR